MRQLDSDPIMPRFLNPGRFPAPLLSRIMTSNNPLNRRDEMKGFSDKLGEAEANRSRLPKSNAADAAHTVQVLL